jgi:hypothetical protein
MEIPTDSNATFQKVLQAFFRSRLHPQLLLRALHELILRINWNGYSRTQLANTKHVYDADVNYLSNQVTETRLRFLHHEWLPYWSTSRRIISF